jgi:flagellar assembly protein FliH
LRVPSTDLDLWSDTIAHLPNLAVKPAVLGDDEMRLGECVLETELGSVNLGVAAQLAEIERGFFDRAGRIPVPSKTTEVGEDMSE